ncbi:universal stress protein [Pseudonocardia sp. RS010]|uniref:universal stress protein n=1 Tax=Pseudonocardia sp. RS010 TaxID=3385979 RepID=UPI0039A227EA
MRSDVTADRPVVVLDDGGTAAGLAAQRWAAAEAARHRLPLRLVGTRDDLAAARTLHRLRREYPRLSVHLTGLSAAPAEALGPLTAKASLLVLPAPAPAAVLAATCCPTAVVPAGEPVRGRVVVGVAPWTREDVLRRAVEEALARDAVLVAARAWSSRLVDLGRVLPAGLTRWDRAAARAERELADTLAPWRDRPGLRLHPVVVRDDAAPLLVMLSAEAELLVLGRSARGAATGTVAGAATAEVLAAARCPVLVVPERPPTLPARDSRTCADAPHRSTLDA